MSCSRPLIYGSYLLIRNKLEYLLLTLLKLNRRDFSHVCHYMIIQMKKPRLRKKPIVLGRSKSWSLESVRPEFQSSQSISTEWLCEPKSVPQPLFFTTLWGLQELIHCLALNESSVPLRNGTTALRKSKNPWGEMIGSLRQCLSYGIGSSGEPGLSIVLSREYHLFALQYWTNCSVNIMILDLKSIFVSFLEAE